MKLTYGDMLCGGGGATQGAIAAGLNHRWGIELDPLIARVYDSNFGHCINRSILDCDPKDFEPVDFLHASPICTEFSSAKIGGKEGDNDIRCALKIAGFIRHMLPKYFTLENVRKYGKPDCISFQIILDTLLENDYQIHFKVINAKHFGVPQSRDRLILRAVRNQDVPPLPEKEPIVGWYSAIKHLVHDLPDSKLADWQIKRFPEKLRGDFRHGLLIERTGARDGRPIQTRLDNEPSWTVRAMGHDGHWHRSDVYLIHPTDRRTMPVIPSNHPCFTLTTNKGGNLIKALLAMGRVVSLDNNCLAKIQTFSSKYQWSGNKVLDGKIRGNSIPPLMYKKLALTLINGV